MENLYNIDVSQYLKEHGIKPSYQRLRIFEYLKKNKSHPTVDEIYQEVVREIPTLSKTTVYNTLNLFIEKNVATVVTIEENETRYDADVSLHGHFKCKSCGKVYDFGVDISRLDFNELEGFQVEEKHLYFKGICNDCSTKL